MTNVLSIMMKTTSIHSITTFLLLLSLATSTWAGQRNRDNSGTYQTGRGQGTWQRNKEGGQGYQNNSTTWQNERGTGTRNQEATWNREDGAAQSTIQTQTAQGKTATINKEASRTGENSYETSFERTGVHGEQSSGTKSVTKNEDGSRSIDGTYTTQKGNTVETKSSAVKTDSGLVKMGTYSTSNGKTGDFNTVVNKESGLTIRSNSLTTSEGKTVSQTATTTLVDGAANHSVITVGPQGQSQTKTGTATINPKPTPTP
jgi:hypothetical protein